MLITTSAVFVVSGVAALLYQVVWQRLLAIFAGADVYSATIVIAAFMTGLGCGSIGGGYAADRVTAKRSLALFAAVETLVGLCGFFSADLFYGVLYLRWGALPAVFATPILFGALLVPTFFMGASLPLLARGLITRLDRAASTLGWLYTANTIGAAMGAVGASWILLPQAGLDGTLRVALTHLGRRTGALLAANIAGSTLGAFVTGLGLLGAAGAATTMKLLCATSATFAVLALRQAQWTGRSAHLAAAGLVVAVTAGLIMLMPRGDLLWARLHGTTPLQIIQREDGSGLALLKSDQDGTRRTVVYTNGIGQSWIPYGDIHTVLGALPAFVHPNPRSAALIGLGSGDTLYAIAGRSEIDRITSIEISKPQLETLRAFVRRQPYPPILTIDSDPRIHHAVGDGRAYLKRTTERFDIIEADALRPESAYSGNLYSDGYFQLLRDRLNPGGLAVTWAPTPRILRTFVKVFPHVWQHGQILMGSDAPIIVDDSVMRRVDVPAVLSHFEWAGVDVHALLRPYTLRGTARRVGPSHDRSAIDDINTDLFPRDEFGIPPLVTIPLINRRGTGR